MDKDKGIRIKTARMSLGIKQTEIASILGIESSFLSNVERGAKKPPKELIELFSSRYKINANWILTGEGDMAIEDAANKTIPLIKEIEAIIHKTTSQKFSEIENRLSILESRSLQEEASSKTSHNGDGALYTADPAPAYRIEYRNEKYDKIPYVHNIAAGPPIPIDGDRSETAEVPSRLLKNGERYYVARIQGDSMTGAGILDGDLVLIRYADIPRDGAIQVVRYQDKVTLKRLREIKGEGWELRYMDGSRKIITCDSDEYETIGEFVTVLPQAANQKEL